jgi:hypothetical protein
MPRRAQIPTRTKSRSHAFQATELYWNHSVPICLNKKCDNLKVNYLAHDTVWRNPLLHFSPSSLLHSTTFLFFCFLLPSRPVDAVTWRTETIVCGYGLDKRDSIPGKRGLLETDSYYPTGIREMFPRGKNKRASCPGTSLWCLRQTANDTYLVTSVPLQQGRPLPMGQQGQSEQLAAPPHT